jgi:L-iditol 2-dehydrogenase
MKAAILVEPRTIEFRDIAEPCVAADEVLIQPMSVGICGSDVSFYLGHRVAKYPWLLGHETVGRVVAVGDHVTRFSAGQRVIVEPNYPCGQCRFCRSGRGTICPNKVSLGVSVPGCFADSFVAPAEFVWPVPDEISDADAVVMEPLAVSLHALLMSDARVGDTVAVVGCGTVGLLLIQVAAAQGVHVLAHSRSAHKLELARRFGAVVLESSDTAQTWRDNDVTTVFETGGTTATVELALSAAPRGTQVVLLGLSAEPASFVPLNLVRQGISIIGSLIYDHPGDFARAIALVKDGTLHPSQIVTHTMSFDAMDRALELASTGPPVKMVVKM